MHNILGVVSGINYLIYLDMVGIIAFSISGYIVASKAGLDILGVTLVTFITAFGGGIIRDIIIDKQPIIFNETYPMMITFVVIILAMVFTLHKRDIINSWIFHISDSIGLVVFAVTGATAAIEVGFNFGGTIMIALITAIGGGIIRDITLNKLPYVFTSDFYGTVAIIMGIGIWLEKKYIDETFVINIIIALGIFIRISAIKYKWELPKFFNKEEA